MRIALLTAALLSTLAPAAMADGERNAVAVLCKKSWPGQRTVQQFCIREQRNYLDWYRFLYKRTRPGSEARSHMDECRRGHRPNFRKVLDCVNDGPGWW